MSSRISNKKSRPRKTPARSRVNYGWRRTKQRALSHKYLGHPNGSTDDIRSAIEAEQAHD